MQVEAYWIYVSILDPRFYPEHKIIYIWHKSDQEKRMKVEKGRALEIHKVKIHDTLEWHTFFFFWSLVICYMYMIQIFSIYWVKICYDHTNAVFSTICDSMQTSIVFVYFYLSILFSSYTELPAKLYFTFSYHYLYF